MKFLMLAVLLAVTLPYSNGLTSIRLAKQCFQKWAHVPQGTKTDDQEQCLRLQIVSDCWSKRTVDSSLFVDQARFFTEQEAIFSNILGICHPKIDVSKLTEVVELSGLKNKYSSIIVDKDEPAQCAVDSYNECLAMYDKLYPNGKTCRNAASLIDCMKEKAKTCKAEIFQHFTQIFNIDLAEEMIQPNANLKMHDLCVRE